MTTRRSLLLGFSAMMGCTACGAQSAPISPSQDGPLRNTLTLRDASGSGAHDYPVRIGRPFVKGEITGVPRAMAAGTALPTQADVKTRWPDGSVQHAILSFVVPHVAPGAATVIEFVNQPAGDTTPIGVQRMLDPTFDFDAVMEITQNGQTRTASARAMLQSGDFTTWCRGPIATTVTIADHSAARKYDIGFDPLRSVRPIFHATFWPGLRKVHVRAIGENANTETLQDLEYSLVVKAGAAKPAEVFRQDKVPQYAATRWTKTFWIGGDPNPAIDVDHNLRYLAATRAFPNFDAGLQVPAYVVEKAYEFWQKMPKALYDGGGWAKYMPTTGGRDDIGPYPGMIVKWLYTGDHRMLELVSGQADLAGAWPLHVREGNPAKKFDAQKQVPGIGRVLSVYARPSVWLFDGRDRSTPEDRISVHGSRTVTDTYPKLSGGWKNDGGHQPDPFSALYTLLGDPYYLEQSQFWAASQALSYDPDYKGIPASGIFMDQVRGCAWVLRNRVHAAFLSPDGSPEKVYFTSLVGDAVAAWEGRFGIRGTSFEGTPAWQWGQSRPFSSPLHFFLEQVQTGGAGLVDANSTSAAQLWQHYLLIFELGRSKEKGFPTGPLLSWLGVLLIGQFHETASYDPYNFQRYATSIRDGNHEFWRTWTATLAAYKDPKTPDKFSPDVHDGYGTYGYAASTMLTGEPGGKEVYAWLRSNGYDEFRNKFAEYPKWAFLARG